jgi:hypothetical protein
MVCSALGEKSPTSMAHLWCRKVLPNVQRKTGGSTNKKTKQDTLTYIHDVLMQKDNFYRKTP